MGQKTHPVGFRLGISKDWKSRYYAGRDLPALLREDELLRKYLKARLGHAAIADIVIDRKPGTVVVTLHTGRPGVVMPDYLRAQYPEDMTIVLQHQFWGLEVGAEAFEVTLSFNKTKERLRIPFTALTSFVDPSVQFGLEFKGEIIAGEPRKPGVEAARPGGVQPGAAGKSGQVVTLEAFRKKQ